MANNDIRTVAKSAGVFLWEIAEKIGISDSNFSRRLRREWPEDERKRVLEIIDEIGREKSHEENANNRSSGCLL